MKKMFSIIFIISVLFVDGFSSTNTNNEIIKQTQKIQYLSQKIANDYIFYFSNSKNLELKKSLQKSIKELESSFRYIASNGASDDNKNILDYLSYSKDEIKTILNDDIKLENTKLILDQSQSLYEGAESILASLGTYKRDIDIDIMKISKIYMQLGIDNSSKYSSDLMQDEIKELDIILSSKSSWKTFKEIISYKQKVFLPHVVMILINDLEEKN